MAAGRRARCWVYGALALVALVATWSQNIAFFAGRGDTGLVGFVRAAWANHAAASLGYDVVLSAVVAVSVAFPLFLIVRERRPAARETAVR